MQAMYKSNELYKSDEYLACRERLIFGVLSWRCAIDALRTARNIKMTILFFLSLLLFGFDKALTYELEGVIDISFKNISDLCMFTSTVVLLMNFILSIYDRYVACKERRNRFVKMMERKEHECEGREGEVCEGKGSQGVVKK